MKTIGFLYEIIGREMIFLTTYSILPSIIVGLVSYGVGFPIGLMVGVTLGAINGVILGILCLLFINRVQNPNRIKGIFEIVSVIVTFICVYIFFYSTLFPYRPNDMLDEPAPDYSAFHITSLVGSIIIALIAGVASIHLSNWYLDYRNQENA